MCKICEMNLLTLVFKLLQVLNPSITLLQYWQQTSNTELTDYVLVLAAAEPTAVILVLVVSKFLNKIT